MYQQYGKRIMDLVGASFGLLLSLPVLLVVVPVLYRVNNGRILFRQRRPGLWGEPFTLYKLQTMTEERCPAGHLLPDEQRLTPAGKLIRRLSLDELPQLYNVLRGDLSLVGPRPLLMAYLPLYSREQFRRHDVKPGMTGWAQVHGRNSTSWEHRFACDLWYVRHISFKTDLLVLFKTVTVVLSGSGLSKVGHATMPRFEGSRVKA
ncbi:sugar transferase [Pontibacter saemangeumensis]|uniref:Sugar transferase n=1 Tax=Pontibacter saemangeumensis TaxID=1084525 RepID=A0ABP8LZE4_9BACT